MTEISRHRLDHLSPAASRLGAAFARPKVLAILCIVVLTALGWLYLGLLVGEMGGPGADFGPGMGVLDLVPRVWAALCSPTFGVSLMPGGEWGITGFVLIALMWGAMTLAMMLPSAAPMILTYAEIADTAARNGQRVVSPFVLTAGYAAIWFGFAATATVAQFGLTRAAVLNPSMASASGLFSGAVFIVAGLYQFSALKHACLRQCRAPFPFFFSNWQTTPRGVFRLGVKQGLFCLGCCWAMMLVMFAVGIMNVVWMAALGVLMTIEKMTVTNRLTYAIGAFAIAAGLALIAGSVIAHWPAAAI
ncbi:MAG: DUF2182 domain-containing protein [Pseudolabrys sp.]|jgi:predicted metal-binding membrane protein